MKRKNISTGAKWEDIVGYSRAVRIGNIVEVSGTVSVMDGELIGAGDPYAQTKRIFQIIGSSLEEAGASITDVIRTRIFVTDISSWEEIGRAHSEVFGKIKPATSMVEIRDLIGDGFLVEIEASAVVNDY